MGLFFVDCRDVLKQGVYFYTVYCLEPRMDSQSSPRKHDLNGTLKIEVIG
nr:MAG TPA: hypothetical protein [Caudoviricetes sp.]